MDIKKVIITVLSVLLFAMAGLLAYIMLVRQPSQKQAQTELKTEKVTKEDKKSTKKSLKSSKKEKEDDQKSDTSEEKSTGSDSSSSANNDLGITTTSGENVNVESILKDSATEYQFDKDAARAFQSEEVFDQQHYVDKVKSESYVARAKSFDLPEKHGEYEKKLSHAFEQLNQIYDKNVASRSVGAASYDPSTIELKTLIADDYFKHKYPHDLFDLMLSTKLNPDLTTLKIVKDQTNNYDFALDVVLVDPEGSQYAYFTTMVTDGQFVQPTVFKLREGAIKYDQQSLNTQSAQAENQSYGG